MTRFGPGIMKNGWRTVRGSATPRRRTPAAACRGASPGPALAPDDGFDPGLLRTAVRVRAGRRRAAPSDGDRPPPPNRVAGICWLTFPLGQAACSRGRAARPALEEDAWT